MNELKYFIPSILSTIIIIYYYIIKFKSKNWIYLYVLIIIINFFYIEIFSFFNVTVFQKIQIHDIFLILLIPYFFKQGYIFKNKILLLLFLWGLFAVIKGYPLFGVSSLGESRQITLFIVIYFIGYHGTVSRQITKKNFECFFTFIGIAIIINHFFSLILFTNEFTSSVEWFRIGGRTNLILVYSLIVILNSNVIHKNIYFFLIVLAIALSQNRSVWLITFIYLSYHFVRNLNITDKVKYAFRGLIILFFLITLIYQYAPSGFIDRFLISSNVINNPEKDQSANWRLISWTREFENIEKSPLIGTGFGNYQYWTINQQLLSFNTHNITITLISRIGFIGYFLFLLVMISALLINNKNSISKQLNYMIIATFIFMNFNAEDTAGTIILLYWILIGFKNGLKNE